MYAAALNPLSHPCQISRRCGPSPGRTHRRYQREIPPRQLREPGLFERRRAGRCARAYPPRIRDALGRQASDGDFVDPGSRRCRNIKVSGESIELLDCHSVACDTPLTLGTAMSTTTSMSRQSSWEADSSLNEGTIMTRILGGRHIWSTETISNVQPVTTAHARVQHTAHSGHI